MPKKTPEPKTPPKPDLVYEIEGAPPKLFVIRHKPSGTWWGPDECGYVESLMRAGTYPEARARVLEARRGEDEAIELSIAARDFVSGANPTVLQALFAQGRR